MKEDDVPSTIRAVATDIIMRRYVAERKYRKEGCFYVVILPINSQVTYNGFAIVIVATCREKPLVSWFPLLLFGESKAKDVPQESSEVALKSRWFGAGVLVVCCHTILHVARTSQLYDIGRLASCHPAGYFVSFGDLS